MKLTAAQMDRAIGSLVGAACGDALGAGYEFGSAPLRAAPAQDAIAVVSLCRIGREQVDPPVVHAESRLIDTDRADNPTLECLIDDAARAVRTLREEGHVVPLHCVAAQSRTPTGAARYGALLGRPTTEALRVVCAVLPAAAPRQELRGALDRLGSGQPSRNENSGGG